MKVKYILLMTFLCALGVVRADSDNWRPIPGAEYEGGKKALKQREFRVVKIADLAEGSPEWVLYQGIMCSKRRDIEELKKYAGPLSVRSNSRLRPDVVEGLAPYRLGPNDDVWIGDGLEEAEWCYIYITFQHIDGRSRKGGCRYFYKRDGQWIHVTQEEWRKGALAPVPQS